MGCVFHQCIFICKYLKYNTLLIVIIFCSEIIYKLGLHNYLQYLNNDKLVLARNNYSFIENSNMKIFRLQIDCKE